MRTIKYHLVLTDNEYSLIINSLNNLRNDLIAQGRYTDAVDDVLVEFIGAKKKFQNNLSGGLIMNVQYEQQGD